MTGTVAQTIQGEAGSDPNAQFAVASTIYNRLNSGNFNAYGASGGAYGIVNAPQQYVGFSATPNASAQMFADAIDNGTLSQYGNTGNATFFQQTGSATTLGSNPNAVNIGGNNFSDQWGSPSANFVAPSYTGMGASSGVIDNASGGTPAYDPLSVSGVPVRQSPGLLQINPSAAPDGSGVTGTGVPGGTAATSGGTGGSGTETVAAAPGLIGTINNWFTGLQSWLTRGLLIIIGLVIVAIALIHVMRPGAIQRGINKLA